MKFCVYCGQPLDENAVLCSNRECRMPVPGRIGMTPPPARPAVPTPQEEKLRLKEERKQKKKDKRVKKAALKASKKAKPRKKIKIWKVVLVIIIVISILDMLAK